MTPLRLIILIAGIVLIAIIYIWETIKQRRQQRKQTISPSFSEQDYPGFRMGPGRDSDNEYADALSELNQSLADTKSKTAFTSQETFSSRSGNAERFRPGKAQLEPETRDLFATFRHHPVPVTRQENTEYHDVDENQIITLHITALPTKTFGGNDILDAVNNVGLEFGDMNIFHHYGIGDMQTNQQLFSLIDMFEPGNFDLSRLDQHNTRGLTLFFCLPVRVDGQVVFELMLNTAQRLAKRLGGEIRGPEHNLLDDAQISAIRNKINEHGQR